MWRAWREYINPKSIMENMWPFHNLVDGLFSLLRKGKAFCCHSIYETRLLSNSKDMVDMLRKYIRIN